MTAYAQIAGERTMTDLNYLDRGGGERLAYRRRSGVGPGVVWLGGFRSDMEGTKARVLEGETVPATIEARYYFDHHPDGHFGDRVSFLTRVHPWPAEPRP